MRGLLPAVVIGCVLLISSQVGARPDSAVGSAVFGTGAVVQRWVMSAGVVVRDAASRVAGLREAQRENAVLRSHIDTLRMGLQEQRALAHKTAVLERLLQFRRSMPWRTVSARVTAADVTPALRTITMDRGFLDRVRPDHAVISPDGVVGRVIGPLRRNTATVQLLIDRTAGAGAYVARTGAEGVVVGTDNASVLLMSWVSSNHRPVVEGDAVMTSGTDGIYPRGLTIGAVDAVERGAGSSWTIRIAAAVDVARLEHVLVVVPPPDEVAATNLIAGGGR